jgi:redox-sensitive bicupin YhaK (pirin superfamily)
MMEANDEMNIPGLRKIAARTAGSKHGPITRLMSPGDFGERLKPFVFLDYFDMQGPPFEGALHPHSGIATLTYVIEGRVDLIDPDGHTEVMQDGGVEWMQAGRGMWHGGSAGDASHGRVRGYQLWVALPPELELGPSSAIFQRPGDIAACGPARVLLGSHGDTSSAIPTPSPMNYLAVTLKAGERWTYLPPAGHTVLWASPAEGSLLANGEALRTKELVAFEASSAAVDFVALSDTHFMLGSAVPHRHQLALGYYSVHTSPEALRQGEEQLEALDLQLRKEGRL